MRPGTIRIPSGLDGDAFLCEHGRQQDRVYRGHVELRRTMSGITRRMENLGVAAAECAKGIAALSAACAEDRRRRRIRANLETAMHK